MKWLSTIKHADERQARARADGARRDRLPAADRRARGARGRLARARARPGGRPLAARRRARHRGRRRRRRRSAPNMMTGHPGIFAGGDMVPAERTVTVGVGHGKHGGAQHRRLAARRARYEPPPEPRARRPSTRSTPGTTPTRRATVRPQLERGPPRSRPSTRSSAASTSRTRSSRRAAACRAATASPATTATASAPTTPCSSSATRRARYAIDLDYCKGCGLCVAGVPVRRDRDGAGGDLIAPAPGGRPLVRAQPLRVHDLALQRRPQWIFDHRTKVVRALTGQSLRGGIGKALRHCQGE